MRLRYAYFIKCEEVVKDPVTGEVVELRCTYDPATRGGYAPDGRQVKATLHWVSAAHAVPAEVRLYDRLFTQARARGGSRRRFQGRSQPRLACGPDLLPPGAEPRPAPSPGASTSSSARATSAWTPRTAPPGPRSSTAP